MDHILLNINGVDRMVTCDMEKDSLAVVLRRIGLTSVKMGCGVGQCGTCTVLLNGEVTRSCAKRMSKVAPYSKIETVEGLGTAGNPHPLQQAWVTYGAVQCGFCSPGFIMSAKGLLDQNPNPTRNEVRAWFQKNKNACRCTGYIPIVDAVMAAAEVLRGEKAMMDITFKPEAGKVYGSMIPRPSAMGKVLGVCDYGGDINEKLPDDALHLAVVQAKVNHGHLRSIDASEAEKMPGFVKLLTAKDVKGTNRINITAGMKRATFPGKEAPVIVDDKICRYGDVVAVVAAKTRDDARAAAALVRVEIEPLPAYMNLPDAVAPDALEIHEGATRNFIVKQPHFFGGDTKEVLARAPRTIEASYYTQRQPHMALEPDCGLAYQDDEGNLIIQYKSQWVYSVAPQISSAIGVPAEKISVVMNPSGASFGYTMSPYMAALVSVAALSTGKPCALTMSFEESQHFIGKRAPAFCNIRLAADKEGMLQAMEYELAFDMGAYLQFLSGLIEKGPGFMGMPYRIPNVKGVIKAAFSNHNYNTTYRSYGTQSATFFTEQAIDELAGACGIDPFEFRYRNYLREGETCMGGYTNDAFCMVKLADRMRPRYEAAKMRCAQRSDERYKYGVGVIGSSYKSAGAKNDFAKNRIELNPDGTVTVYNTWQDLGQGGDVGTLVHTCQALRELDLQPEQIKLIQSDTRICPDSGKSAGSRSHFMNGLAILDAARQMLETRRKSDGTFRTYQELMDEGLPTKFTGTVVMDEKKDPELGHMDPNTGLGKVVSHNSFNLMMAEVMVDTETGKTTVISFDVESSIGPVGSRQAVDGQAYSGIYHGIGLALSENYDDVKASAYLAGAGMKLIESMPDDVKLHYLEDHKPGGPQGSIGCSEAFQSGPAAAVVNAIYNACGVRIRELPALPKKIKQALEDKAAGTGRPIIPYDLGDNFDALMEEIRANPV